MIPPKPFPSWWHGNPTYFPRCVKDAEKEAYADLQSLRFLWIWRNYTHIPTFPSGLGCLWAWIKGLA